MSVPRPVLVLGTDLSLLLAHVRGILTDERVQPHGHESRIKDQRIVQAFQFIQVPVAAVQYQADGDTMCNYQIRIQ